jgi:hypothetical protein
MSVNIHFYMPTTNPGLSAQVPGPTSTRLPPRRAQEWIGKGNGAIPDHLSIVLWGPVITGCRCLVLPLSWVPRWLVWERHIRWNTELLSS